MMTCYHLCHAFTLEQTQASAKTVKSARAPVGHFSYMFKLIGLYISLPMKVVYRQVLFSFIITRTLYHASSLQGNPIGHCICILH